MARSMASDGGERFRSDRLKSQRQARGWNQKQLAARLNVHVSTVSKWETGEHPPSAPQIPDLIAAFPETTRDYWFGADGPAAAGHGARNSSISHQSTFGHVEQILLGYWSVFYTSSRVASGVDAKLIEARLVFYFGASGSLDVNLIDTEGFWTGTCSLDDDGLCSMLHGGQFGVAHKILYLRTPYKKVVFMLTGSLLRASKTMEASLCFGEKLGDVEQFVKELPESAVKPLTSFWAGQISRKALRRELDTYLVTQEISRCYQDLGEFYQSHAELAYWFNVLHLRLGRSALPMKKVAIRHQDITIPSEFYECLNIDWALYDEC